MRMIDMHAHLFCFSEYEGQKMEACSAAMRQLAKEELLVRRDQGIKSFFSTGKPEEWEFASELFFESDRGRACVRDSYLSFGIHPWYSDRYEPDDYTEYFRACDAIGEIGADSVWCDVPLKRQFDILNRQLEIAARYEKPVILHTKGQEAPIAGQIRDFPGKVLVHWYSGDMQSLARFCEADCYFTLGPDLACCQEYGDRTAVERYAWMLREIPAERLFIETDGLVSIAWMKEEHGKKEQTNLIDIPETLRKSLIAAAKAKRMEPEELCDRMQRNLRDFLGCR